MPLLHTPNIADPDGFYEALVASQRDLDDDEADLMLAKLVLILANQVGDRQVLDEALQLARPRRPAARSATGGA